MFGKDEGRWVLIVHGGAKPWEKEEEQANRDGIAQAVQAGSKVLADGGSAVDAVEAAIRVLEDLPVFNAGTGSAPNEAGGIEMCSGLMDGSNLSAGAVGAIRNVRHPITVARQLLPEKEILLVGEGALLFAKANGATLATDEELKAEAEKQALAEGLHDTVGAVAMDTGGNLAAGTSTGGLNGQKVGRIGDSPLPGGGLYADNHLAAISFSGDGETITRLALASRVMASIEDGLPMEEAIAKGLAKLPGTGGADADGGAIGIDKHGTLAWAHNSPMFAVAYLTAGMAEPKAFLHKDEETRG
ncbi:MAG TPA: isoaspartyl peptidase/L-asparaginase family protein [Allosphingosinicella sp.]|jgi:beta-aspartyl-peptidase (threonine type)